MRFHLPEIHRNPAGFDALAYLYAQTKELLFDDIEIDMKETHWFDADMCAAFGAILYSLEKRLNTVSLIQIPLSVKEILSKNGFLSRYGGVEIPDQWGTTISYQRFDKNDRYVARYVENEFMHRSEIPKMSPELLKKLSESISEIFVNAISHSRTRLGIFSCGQFFPTKERLDFTVADLGIGIRQNIKDCIELDLSAEKAIVWATEGNSTTRGGNVPGGLGLKLLGEFIDLNHGCIKIVSDAGYWQRENGEIFTALLNYRFPGTVVSVEINTADTSAYRLVSD